MRKIVRTFSIQKVEATYIAKAESDGSLTEFKRVFDVAAGKPEEVKEEVHCRLKNEVEDFYCLMGIEVTEKSVDKKFEISVDDFLENAVEVK